MPQLSLTFLGGFEARLDPGPTLIFPTRKVEALLAYLALPPGQPHLRDKLAALLWGEAPEVQARASLRQGLFALRRALTRAEPAPLRFDGQAVLLSSAAVDVATFEMRVAEGTPEGLKAGARLYRGELLAGLRIGEGPFEEWLLAERERLRELAIGALARLLAHERQAGATEAAVQTALRLLTFDPLQESVHRTLMRLYAGLGRRAAALRQYQYCVDTLQRELRVEPEAETSALYQQILRQRPPARTMTPEPVRARAEGTAPPPRAEAPLEEAPFVGRAGELEELLSALYAAHAGQGRAMAVRGEVGIGKSRLLAELVGRAAAREGAILLGRAHEPDRILPFGPWIDALQGARVTLDTALLGALGLAWRAELGRILPEVRRDDAPPASPPDLRVLFEGLVRLLRCLADRQGALLILDDLHWADETSVRFLSFLARRLSDARLLVVISAGDEELDDAPWLAATLQDLVRLRRLTELRLGPLSRPDTLTLVRALVEAQNGQLDVARVGEAVWAASEGHPLLALETLRSFDGNPRADSHPAQPPAEALRKTIGRRLATLDEDARRLVAVAAVAGWTCDFPLLGRATGLDDAAAAEVVENLVRRRVFHAVGDRLEFAHSRIRDVALAEVLPLRRAALHRRLAESMESLYAGDLNSHCLAIGSHYAEGEVWGKAVAFLRRAGSAAADRAAYREAATSFERALAALEHWPPGRATIEQAIDLRLELQASLIALGDIKRLLDRLREAEPLAGALGDPHRMGRVATSMAFGLFATGRPDQAAASGEKALAIARTVGDPGLEARANVRLAQAYRRLGEYPRAIAANKRNIDALVGDLQTERFGMASLPAVDCRAFMGGCLAEMGEFRAALAVAEEGVCIAEAADDRLGLALAQAGVGNIYLRQGHPDRALPWLEQSLDGSRRFNFEVAALVAAGPLGEARAVCGATGEAIAFLEQAAERANSIRYVAVLADILPALGKGYILAGRLAEAQHTAERMLDLTRGAGQRYGEANAQRILGEVHAQAIPAQTGQAEESYREALGIAEQIGTRPLVAHCYLGLGKLLRRTSQRERARDHLTTATTMYREMDITFWLEQAEAELKALA